MLTLAIYPASTETVPMRWREKVMPAEKLLGTSQLASQNLPLQTLVAANLYALMNGD
jgi:hypothetical protein